MKPAIVILVAGFALAGCLDSGPIDLVVANKTGEALQLHIEVWKGDKLLFENNTVLAAKSSATLWDSFPGNGGLFRFVVTAGNVSYDRGVRLDGDALEAEVVIWEDHVVVGAGYY
jgi:hypothetical protein